VLIFNRLKAGSSYDLFLSPEFSNFIKMPKKGFFYFYILLISSIFFSIKLYAQHKVNWGKPYVAQQETRSWLNCEDCYNEEVHGLPVLVLNLALPHSASIAVLADEVFAPLDSLEKVAMTFADADVLVDTIPVQTVFSGINEENTHQVSFIPLRKNPLTGEIEKLLSFALTSIKGSSSTNGNVKRSEAYATRSMLESGDWYRVSVSENGIHQLTYNDLVGMGVSANGLSSAAIRVHGYGGGMLPERVGSPRNDDLPEVPVRMIDGGDGNFGPGDYLLFYAQGPTKWKFNATSGIFNHTKHLYDDYAYYYIGVRAGNGSRMVEFPQPQTPPSVEVNDFDWYYTYEPDEFMLVKSGKEWFGDIFDVVSERNYTLPAFTPLAASQARIRLSVAARSTAPSSFTLKAGDNSFTNFVSPIITEANTDYARMSTETYTLQLSSNFDKVNLKYNKSVSASLGWLNFIEINAKAVLSYSGGMMHFRKTGVSGVVGYNFSGSGTATQLWDVTDPQQPGFLVTSSSGNGFQFRALADVIREYVVADNGSYLKPAFVEKVANQNLHGASPHSMVIVAHPDFAEEAARLAEFHASHDNLSVLVVSPQTIYNEFSSGAQDISAIRDFMAMLWNKGESWNKPRFLLLFGDASYDYKNIIGKNTNFVPTWQSVESMHPVNSIATDDFFGCFDEGEGGQSKDVVDIGIGRLVVQTPEEAKNAVDKIIHYVTASNQVHGDWRNVIAFVADDGDSNEHMRQANQLATMIDTTYKNYNTEKIFLDAYPQISTPGGQRVPDATLAINQRMGKGALLVNYTGHGGETGWAHEEVLKINDINSWTNYDRLPVFMTATCEFSRYDDPLRISAGELVFLNPKGGGIALFTTTRPTYGPPNFTLAQNFYNLALKPTESGMPYLGDLIRISKQLSGTDNNGKKFVLLGDPALKMSYPQFNVYTTSINGNETGAVSDTLKAMDEVTITGFVGDENGMPITDFTGVITPTIFDKANLVETLGSDGASRMIFSVRRNIIYKGNALVENGYFTLSFIVPRDIAYQFGEGKISYYATDGARDAAGQFDRFVVGGISNTLLTDNDGPDIRLFMNDTLFVTGGVTDENPVLLAFIHDQSGINTIGTSIGHDIVAILDGKTDAPFVLNDFYQADLNTYKSGRVSFPLKGIEPGHHSLTLKLWDTNNNSSDANIEFFVSSSGGLELGPFEVYPNPFSENAHFIFGHNKAGEDLQLELGIYNLTGKRVAMLNRTIFAGGYRSPAFEWNGTGANGSYLASGLYIGRLKVRDMSGNESVTSVKISLIR
jgi:hypothetical protein